MVQHLIIVNSVADKCDIVELMFAKNVCEEWFNLEQMYIYNMALGYLIKNRGKKVG